MQSAITLDMHPVEAVLSLVLAYMTKPTKGVVHGQIQSQWRFLACHQNGWQRKLNLAIE